MLILRCCRLSIWAIDWEWPNHHNGSHRWIFHSVRAPRMHSYAIYPFRKCIASRRPSSKVLQLAIVNRLNGECGDRGLDTDLEPHWHSNLFLFSFLPVTTLIHLLFSGSDAIETGRLLFTDFFHPSSAFSSAHVASLSESGVSRVTAN